MIVARPLWILMRFNEALNLALIVHSHLEVWNQVGLRSIVWYMHVVRHHHIRWVLVPVCVRDGIRWGSWIVIWYLQVLESGVRVHVCSQIVHF